MNNFQVFKKTISFSLVNFLVGLLEFGILVGACLIGFYLMNTANDKALIGLAIGFVVGILIIVLLNFLVNNRIKAAQVGMMAKGVVDGELPDKVFVSGIKEVNERFGRITMFFIVTGAIKSMFRQLGRAINKLGTAVGGEVGGTVTSAIDSFIQILIGYLADCCLGWVMYNKKKGVAQSACEGAVIFFKHGKTLIRNIGRIFGLGFLSFLVIGGAFFGLSYLILNQFPQLFQSLANEITEVAQRNSTEVAEFLTNPTTLMLFAAAIIAVIFWTMIHGLLVRPFILVGVLRNFMTSGMKEQITEQDFDILDSKSPKFAKMRARMD